MGEAANPSPEALAAACPGVWSVPLERDVADLVARYAATPRAKLGFSERSDFALANDQYMADRNSLDLIVLQTAAKERIRWLAVQLAIVMAERADLLVMTGCKDRAELEDMANIGRSFMDRMEAVVTTEGPFKGWVPADDPAELVTDLFNALEEATPQVGVGHAEKVLAAWKIARRVGGTTELQRLLADVLGLPDWDCSLAEAEEVVNAALNDTSTQQAGEGEGGAVREDINDKGPPALWLGPECCAKLGERLWSEDHHEECDCDEPGPETKYIRADLVPSPPIQAAGVGRDELRGQIGDVIAKAMYDVTDPDRTDNRSAEERALDVLALLPQPDQSPSPALDVSGGKQPFERYPALASWIERLGNSPIGGMGLGDWMVFVGALNQAILAAERRLSASPPLPAPAEGVDLEAVKQAGEFMASLREGLRISARDVVEIDCLLPRLATLTSPADPSKGGS